MVVVAVAGGTGGVGKPIVEALKGQRKHEVLVLTRKSSEDQVSNAEIVYMEYGDVDEMANILNKYHVHTVISAISVIDFTSSANQVNLIQAAAKNSSTKRFIASDWGVPYTERAPVYSLREAAFHELRKTDLDWTRFVCGYFLDGYGVPYMKTYASPQTFVVDMRNKIAAIPGSGNDMVSFTYSFDLAKFVAASLDIPKWEEFTYCFSDKMTFNKFVELAEEARGSKFKVSYDSLDKLKRGEVTELPPHLPMYRYFPKFAFQLTLALLCQYVVEGKFDIPEVKSLNAMFPDIDTMKVKDVLALWRGM